MMNSSIYINLFSATVGIVMGFLLLTGIVLPGSDGNTRLVLGLIFVSYGLYRYLHVYNKRKLMKRLDEREKMKQAQEDLIKKQNKV